MKQSLAVKTFEDLFAELGERARTRPAGSATVAALDGGVHGLGKKILEEAGEVWLAAEHEPDDALAEEISQLLYWTQVLMVARGLSSTTCIGSCDHAAGCGSQQGHAERAGHRDLGGGRLPAPHRLRT